MPMRSASSPERSAIAWTARAIKPQRVVDAVAQSMMLESWRLVDQLPGRARETPASHYSLKVTPTSAMTPRPAMKPAMIPAIEYGPGCRDCLQDPRLDTRQRPLGAVQP
jgi:hypothetical protein